MKRLSRADFEEARARLSRRVHRTPLLSFRTLGEAIGARVFLKCENLQKTGAFKVRGALNSIALLDESHRQKGVVTISAGNHAQAVAWGAAQYGIPATVVMPEGASTAKVEATKGYGARVVLHGTASEAFREAYRIAEDDGLTFLHPFDAEPVIAGHGSTALEIAEELEGPLTVVVPVGGGGQISGIAGALDAIGGGHRVFGVEPVGADAMTQSLARGEPVTLEALDTIADGLASPMAGVLNFEYVKGFVEDVTTVTDEDLLSAMALVLTRAKLLVEPSGAAGVAALMTKRIPLRPGDTVVAVLSGGNVDPELIVRALDRDAPWP